MVAQYLARLQPQSVSDFRDWGKLLGDVTREEQPCVLVYPAAGFDWRVPVALERLREKRPWLPRPDVAIYIDYSRDLLARLDQLHSAGDKCTWGPGVQLTRITKLSPPEEWLWRLRVQGCHAPEGGSVFADHWYALWLRIKNQVLPVLYVAADAVAFVKEIMLPLGARPDYLATVTDGCRQGGGWCCLGSSDGPLYRHMAEEEMLPKYWLTDHNDLPLRHRAVGEVRTGVYGGGVSTLLAMQTN